MRLTGKRTVGFLIIAIGFMILFERFQMLDAWLVFGYLWIAAIVLFLAELWLDQKKRFFEEEQIRIHKPSVLFLSVMTVVSLSAGNLDSFSSMGGIAIGGGFENSEDYHASFEMEESVDEIALTLTNASLTIRTHAEDSVVIDGKVKGSGLGMERLANRFEERLEINQDGDRMHIEHDQSRMFSFPVIGRQLKLEADLFIPQDLFLQVSLVNGSILSDGVKGDAEVSVVNGPISVTGQKGDVLASATNGRIRISDVTGTVSATGTNGDIQLSNVESIVSAKTVNGSVSVESLDQGGDWDLETVNGRINVRIPRDSDVMFEGNTTNGSVSGDADWERAFSGNNIRENRHGATQIGIGTWNIQAKSVNGHIRLEFEQEY
ncbi:DUF4097 family beta strand repeat-containing protein [Salisediminibacterium selenitireducens]|uniref:DUF4097 domain-containing protein n=1 Tax=Bacillus selenitireducens (strain ATCC 700615 / DSM 15326 / MLS10) TaxID=439292 RepID=D6XW31_BACIE|nr:DUF4097 family beta strand repeat-containing protein [Salisediminibacterium selenitireducens]ADH99785.1 hypothetical protein Bsel_2282 [[Bacillus] selenitireducens MLS10]